MQKINIAVAGGACTGKSTLAASLFARLKEDGLDYDLVTEEKRKLAKEFGSCRSPFDRFYIWRQQEREELRSSAVNGFVTDTALYQLYIQARYYASERRDELAVRELFRMCLELEESNRYQLIVLAENPLEIPYRNDQNRKGKAEGAYERHALLRSFLEHHCPNKLLFVSGSTSERLHSVLSKLQSVKVG